MSDLDFWDDDSIEPEDDRDFNDDWNESGERGTTDPFVIELMDTLGIERVEQFVVDFSQVDPSELRGGRFPTLEDAILHLHGLSVLSFSKVVYYPEEDKYGAAIPPDTP